MLGINVLLCFFHKDYVKRQMFCDKIILKLVSGEKI